MKAAKHSPSIKGEPHSEFTSVLLQCGKQTLPILDHNFEVSARGMSFKTDSYFAPFTNLSVRLQLPPRLGQLRCRTIHCEGVVVECRGAVRQKMYWITVAFLNLDARDEKELSLAAALPGIGITPLTHSPTGVQALPR
jgi:hypothetical protein